MEYRASVSIGNYTFAVVKDKLNSGPVYVARYDTSGAVGYLTYKVGLARRTYNLLMLTVVCKGVSVKYSACIVSFTVTYSAEVIVVNVMSVLGKSLVRLVCGGKSKSLRIAYGVSKHIKEEVVRNLGKRGGIFRGKGNLTCLKLSRKCILSALSYLAKENNFVGNHRSIRNVKPVS